MEPSLHNDITLRLAEFNFKLKGKWFREGVCPGCGKKELYTHSEEPWLLKCGRLNNCGYEAHVKELYPDLFNNWSERYPTLPAKNPNATADAYMQHARGFDLKKVSSWYTQESHFDQRKNIGSATVRFPVGTGYWERLIDQPHRFGSQKAKFKPGMTYQGEWWAPPTGNLANVKEIWLVEGIFDAIALYHHDITAVALLSCTNYPDKALANLMGTQEGQICKLIWALDSDNAGRIYTLRWIERATEEGWICEARQIPQRRKHKLDWNDMHQRDRLSEKDLETYRFHGAMLTAKTPAEKALLIYEYDGKKSEFHFDFKNRLYWFKLDIEAYGKARDMQAASPDADSLSDDEKRHAALMASHNVRPIANCLPKPLYFQENRITDESWYYFRVEFPHDGVAVKNTFTSAHIASAAEFKKRLLAIAPGAMYSGTSGMLDRIMEDELYNIRRVETVDYIGYSIEHGCYVLGDVAVKDGSFHDLNNEDFFDIGKLSLKSLNKSVSLKINRKADEYRRDWLDLLWTAFGAKGLAALTFWFGSLFAEQIRAAHSSYPFLEIIGEAGAGKSTLIEFLWKLFGRGGYEGFDPSKSSLAARARNFAQVSGLPVVLIESDRERTEGNNPHVRSFDWDELKTAYNGRSVRARGMATGGNETYEPPFRGSIVISQNNAVNASEAILSRIIHLNFDRSEQTKASGEAADALKFMDVDDVSGFILAATKREAAIMDTVRERTPVYIAELRQEGLIRFPRLIENHAQMLALADALEKVVRLTPEQKKSLENQLRRMAAERQQVINSDHPLVQEFWEAFDYLDGTEMPRMNHSRDLSLIAVNLNHFVQEAAEKRQQVPPLRELKKLLKTSRNRKYLGQRPVNSNVWGKDGAGKTVKCWIFENTKG